MKLCIKCDTEKDFSEFHNNKASPDGLQKWCKCCRSSYNHSKTEHQKAYQKQYRKANFDKIRDQKRQKIYGVSRELFDAMLQNQDHKCAICKTPVDHGSALDHCHTTGKIRGILCSCCNTALGKFRDNIDNLNSAIEYLNKHSSFNYLRAA